jgi:zinc finger SWIM domain-containing protein 3
MSFEEKLIISGMRAQNVSASQIWHYLAEKTGGSQNLTFKLKDVCNQITDENRRMVGVDVEIILGYFRKKQEEDYEFFFAILPVDYGAIKNLLWIDGRARRAYREFGDVITFDTTYNTNRYCMPLAMFIGVNHH